MKGGHDLVLANRYTNDTDIVKGGRAYDKIKVNDGDRHDTASGAEEATGASLTPAPKLVRVAPG
jgi:hypothetical protein